MAPVVSASLGALGPLLVKLTALLAGECGRLKGVRREIRSLKSELTSMHAAVQKYTMLDDPDVQVKAWISLVRELAYDIEDCVDKFIHQLGSGGRHGSFKDFFRKTARRLKTLGSRCGIANQIDDLKARVKQVKELKSSYKLDDIACSTSSNHAAVDPRLSALFAEEAHLVGIDGPRDDLAKWMMEEDRSTKRHRRVLSIVGFGGLGKTTLAHEVYRKIQGHYHCQAFISVSQKPDIKKIIKDVIYKMPCPAGFIKDIDVWDEITSIARLRELLKDKRYLIIIDDIWSISAWNAIKCAFPENNSASRIITTTRISEVASLCCSGGDDRIYDIEPLSPSHSRRLFFKRVFGSKDCCPEMLKEVSNQILKKCGGLPLAIISISGLLANIPVDKKVGEGEKDYVIERERLVWRWIGEGFISEERGQSLQEVAENNFYELINKSMVQPIDIGYDGKARACRVHDMMLELIISKSAEENFITVVNGGQTVWENSHGYIRRLSIQHIDQDLASILASKNLRHVRSLTITGPCCIKHLPGLSEFETLRVLDLKDCISLGEYDMTGISKLFQLKYLGLGGSDISKLPSEIVMLHDLETLDLRRTNIQELPAGIVQLVKLQVLLVGITQIPKEIENMRNLRVVSGLDITMSSIGAIEELGSLVGLSELHLDLNSGGSDEYKRHEEMLLSILCKLGTCKLQSLWIYSSDSSPLEFLDSWSPLPSSLQSFRMTTSYYFLKTPKWIELASLAYLNINLFEVTQEDLCMLGKLPALLCLELWFKSNPKERLTIQGFPNVKEFVLKCKRGSGAYFMFVEGVMPKLEILELPFLVSTATTYGFYLGIGHFLYLREARVYVHLEDTTYSESMAAAAVIRNEASVHPNHPRVFISGECNLEADSDEEMRSMGDDDTYDY